MSADQIEHLASAWLAREDSGLSPEERSQLDAWLGESSLHQVSYLRLKASWQRADRLAALGAGIAHAPERRVSRSIKLAALAAAVAMLFWSTAYLAHRLDSGKAYATAVGGRQVVQLADGTRMELNTNTRVRAQVTDSLRRVTLDAGEAYFEVVHDAQRPFVVYAGNQRITDLGTKFSVFRNGDDVRVVVREGRVQVEMLGAPGSAAPVVADAGREVLVREAQILVTSKPDEELTNGLSWRNGLLVFRQQTLAEAAEQFNRYNDRQIFVAGSARRIRIGGSFKANNLEVFVQLLHEGFGLSVSDQGDRIVVSR
jgi:transmembrane sensor